MIDTSKYEGHNAPWKVIECIDDIRVVGELNAIDAQLIADASLLLEEVKRLRERIDYLESIAEEYRQERPEEYCANCYAYISEYDGDGVKECLCSDCEEVIE
tara:strand:+ start:100 stop:405 length:306 start_codon:yes stop_codon:yes gene_type:complete